MGDVEYRPEVYPHLIPYLSVQGAAAAIEFYCEVLGGTERMRMPGPGDTVVHAEVMFGDSMVMISDESKEFGNLAPPTIGGSPVGLTLYVEDCAAVHAAALAAGATEVSPPTDQFYGDRSSTIIDPFGHHWHLMTHIEDVSEEEMARRMGELATDG